MGMTYHDFNLRKKQWFLEWREKWGPLDIDLKTFMLMHGVTEDQFNELSNYKPNTPSASHDDYDNWHPHESL
jgi:hypothetical protein